MATLDRANDPEQKMIMLERGLHRRQKKLAEDIAKLRDQSPVDETELERIKALRSDTDRAHSLIGNLLDKGDFNMQIYEQEKARYMSFV